MKNVKNYFKDFVQDESGMELLQLAIVVVITVGLIGVVGALGTNIHDKISAASDDVKNMDTEIKSNNN